MSAVSLVAVYFVVWWIVLFAVLPFGVRTQDEEGEVVLGTPASAPAKPRLVRTAIVTSLVAAVVTALIWVVFGHYGVGVREIADWLDGQP